jgi:hypothetical protein
MHKISSIYKKPIKFLFEFLQAVSVPEKKALPQGGRFHFRYINDLKTIEFGRISRMGGH